MSDEQPELSDEDLAEEQAIEWWRQNRDPFQEDMDQHPPPIGNESRF